MLRDTLTFGLAIPLALAIVIYFQINANPDTPSQAWYICYAVVAGFAFIYIRLVQARKKALDKFEWIAALDGKYGFLVDWENYKGEAAKILPAAEKVIQAWEEAEPDWPVRKVVQERPIRVWFKKELDERPHRGVPKSEGATVSNTHWILVDYDTPTDMLRRTAFDHELGHLIQGHCTNDWDEDTHHKRSKSHNLR